MNLRYGVAAVAAVGCTFGALVLMTTLISQTVDAAVAAEAPRAITVTRINPPEPTPPRIVKPQPPAPPAALPASTPRRLTVEYAPQLVVRGPSLPPGSALGGTGAVVDPADPSSDGPPVALVTLQPPYPEAQLARGVEGTVIVEFDVTASGLVDNARIYASSHPGFERAALRTIERFRFKPRFVDGKPVATPGLRKQFRFQIER